MKASRTWPIAFSSVSCAGAKLSCSANVCCRTAKSTHTHAHAHAHTHTTHRRQQQTPTNEFTVEKHSCLCDRPQGMEVSNAAVNTLTCCSEQNNGTHTHSQTSDKRQNIWHNTTLHKKIASTQQPKSKSRAWLRTVCFSNNCSQSVNTTHATQSHMKLRTSVICVSLSRSPTPGRIRAT